MRKGPYKFILHVNCKSTPRDILIDAYTRIYKYASGKKCPARTWARKMRMDRKKPFNNINSPFDKHPCWIPESDLRGPMTPLQKLIFGIQYWCDCNGYEYKTNTIARWLHRRPYDIQREIEKMTEEAPIE